MTEAVRPCRMHNTCRLEGGRQGSWHAALKAGRKDTFKGKGSHSCIRMTNPWLTALQWHQLSSKGCGTYHHGAESLRPAGLNCRGPWPAKVLAMTACPKILMPCIVKSALFQAGAGLQLHSQIQLYLLIALDHSALEQGQKVAWAKASSPPLP